MSLRPGLTFQDYRAGPRIEGVTVRDLKLFHDDAGAFAEIFRHSSSDHPWPFDRQVQANLSILAPRAVKAFHVHPEQTDAWLIPPTGRALVLLFEHREEKPGYAMRLTLGDGRAQLLTIPAGVAHGIRNLSYTDPLVMVYFVDQEFGAGEQEGRLPWDYLGADVWNEKRE